MYRYPDAIVETGWLAANLDAPNLRIFDCTTHLLDATEPGQPYRVESGRADYDLGHIPGAGFLDVISDILQLTEVELRALSLLQGLDLRREPVVPVNSLLIHLLDLFLGQLSKGLAGNETALRQLVLWNH